jgi:uncharacterized membrane protein
MENARQFALEAVMDQQRSRRAIFVWLLAVAGSWSFVGAIIAAPLLLTSGYLMSAGIIYRAFSLICHQQAARSFSLAGHQLAVCARCSGLYAGFAAGALIYPILRPLATSQAPDRRWLFWAAAPTVIDFLLGFLGIWANTHASRSITGALLGFVSVFYVMPGLVDLVGSNLLRFKAGENPREDYGDLRSPSNSVITRDG